MSAKCYSGVHHSYQGYTVIYLLALNATDTDIKKSYPLVLSGAALSFAQAHQDLRFNIMLDELENQLKKARIKDGTSVSVTIVPSFILAWTPIKLEKDYLD